MVYFFSQNVELKSCLCWINCVMQSDYGSSWYPYQIPLKNKTTWNIDMHRDKKSHSYQLKESAQSRLVCDVRETFLLSPFRDWISFEWNGRVCLDKTQSEMQSVQFRDHLHLHAATLIGLHVQIECGFLARSLHTRYDPINLVLCANL